MSCPTCEHTMHNVSVSDDEEQLFWCPRCGALKSGVSDTTPTLAETVYQHRGADRSDYELVELKLWGDGCIE